MLTTLEDSLICQSGEAGKFGAKCWFVVIDENILSFFSYNNLLLTGMIGWFWRMRLATYHICGINNNSLKKNYT